MFTYERAGRASGRWLCWTGKPPPHALHAQGQQPFPAIHRCLAEKLSYKDRIVAARPAHEHRAVGEHQAVADQVRLRATSSATTARIWKLHAAIYVRDTEEAMTEVYPPLMAPDTQWQVYREYYCPTCGTMHDVEAPTPWYR